MPVLEALHDRMHIVESDEAWSESYYFNAYDPDTDSGIFSRIGIRPNEGSMDGTATFWLPNKMVASFSAKCEQTTMCESPLEVGDLTYECLEVGNNWRITLDTTTGKLYQKEGLTQATIKADLVFEALMPMIGVDGQGKSGKGASVHTGQSVGKGHLEQAGRWTGWIEVNGEKYTFGSEAMGNRDKSWGPRRWGGPKMWRWWSINISKEVHFGGIRIGTDAGDLHRGWVWKDGEHSSIQDWTVKTETRSDGVTQKTCYVTATDKKGRKHELQADVLRVIPGGAKPGGTIVNEGLSKWTYEGVTGHGIAEYLHQFDDDGNPLVPIE